MDVLAERLDCKLREWKPEKAELARQRIAEIIDATDEDGLDLLRSRQVEQEVVDLIDDDQSR